ncbi:hypothetical protein [Cytobacillus praedii]|uniref:hypothetical protein n=1 Tax=Cytobacillus praedii TaxID=1742358 RepID=UPI002E1B7E29|nr:hypothetical protein [Cytobacillus praedii]
MKVNLEAKELSSASVLSPSKLQVSSVTIASNIGSLPQTIIKGQGGSTAYDLERQGAAAGLGSPSTFITAVCAFLI